MKIILSLSLILWLVIPAEAQQFSVGAGKSISFFDYKNSGGEKLSGLHSASNIYLNIGYRKSIWSKNLFLHLQGMYNTYGATGSDRSLDNYFNWKMNYLGLAAGLNYEFYHTGNFIITLLGSASLEFLIQGTQTINSQVYDLSKQEDFKSPFYFLRGGLGVQYKASEQLGIFTQYMYGRGSMFKDHQGDLKIKEHRFGVGMYISLSKRGSAAYKEDVSIPAYDSTIYMLQNKAAEHEKEIRELKAQQDQVANLRQQLAEKEKEIERIRASIKEALYPYQGDELKVRAVDGVVYVTLSNDLIFASGSTELSPSGQESLRQLGDVLAQKDDLKVAIVGHTDNQPFKGGTMNNWDLSVQRATAVVDFLLVNKKIDPSQITAAGKGDHEPVADNSTEEGRKKNRRIEVIITPNLDKLSKLIKN